MPRPQPQPKFQLTYSLFMLLWKHSATTHTKREHLIRQIIDSICQNWHPGPYLVLLHMIAKEAPDTQRHLKDGIRTLLESEKYNTPSTAGYAPAYRDILDQLDPDRYPRSDDHLQALWGPTNRSEALRLLGSTAEEGPEGQGLTPAQYIAWFHPASYQFFPPEKHGATWNGTLGNPASGLKPCYDYLPWLKHPRTEENSNPTIPSPENLYAEHGSIGPMAKCTADDVRRLCSLIRDLEPQDQPAALLTYLNRIFATADKKFRHVPVWNQGPSQNFYAVWRYVSQLEDQRTALQWPLQDLLLSALFYEKPNNISESERQLFEAERSKMMAAWWEGRERYEMYDDIKVAKPLFYELGDLSEYPEEELLENMLNGPEDNLVSMLESMIAQKNKQHPNTPKPIKTPLLLQALLKISNHDQLTQMIAKLSATNFVLDQSVNPKLTEELPAKTSYTWTRSQNSKLKTLQNALRDSKKIRRGALSTQLGMLINTHLLQQRSTTLGEQFKLLIQRIILLLETVFWHLNISWSSVPSFFRTRAASDTHSLEIHASHTPQSGSNLNQSREIGERAQAAPADQPPETESRSTLENRR